MAQNRGWKRLAEICGEHLHKGKQVYIEGSLRSRKWQDRDGNERTSFEVVANRMVMLGSKGGEQGAGNGSHGNGRSVQQPKPEPATTVDDSDLPF